MSSSQFTRGPGREVGDQNLAYGCVTASHEEPAMGQLDEEYDSVDEIAFYQLAESLDPNTRAPSLHVVDAGLLKSLEVDLDYALQDSAMPTGERLSSCPSAVTLDEIDQSKATEEEVEELDRKRAILQLTPYERFRARRNRLSISDLVSPLWCTAQFQYALEKGGKKRRTPAMKEGHKIHAALEREIHVLIPFEIDESIPEEQLGLKLLNMVHGLSELWSGQITRELPVLGFTDDTFVTGVIDELKFEDVHAKRADPSGDIVKFLHPVGTKKRHIVLSDAKTRVSHRPPADTQVDQAKLQLMLYWDLLRSLPELDLSRLLKHENLDGDRAFSDDFLRQALQMLGSVSDEIADKLLSSNSIRGLWALLKPKLLETRNALCTEMEITYIHQKTKTTILVKRFDLDKHWATERLTSIMAWWKGDRSAEGVPVEEAYKCGICEFEAGCAWRKKKIQDHTESRWKERSRGPSLRDRSIQEDS